MEARLEEGEKEGEKEDEKTKEKTMKTKEEALGTGMCMLDAKEFWIATP